MCGRATLSTPVAELREIFDLDEAPDLTPRYNVAPTQPIAIVRDPHRLELLRWGLLLPNAKNQGARGINVRVESVARAPAYRSSFRHRRCLVVVDGFYEWKRTGQAKQPYVVRREDRKPFAMAGIWNRSTTEDGELIDSCAVITAEAKGVVAGLHDRMPIIVPPTGYARWLDVHVQDVTDLLGPRADGLIAYAVSMLVNSPQNEDPRCVEPVEPDVSAGTQGMLNLW